MIARSRALLLVSGASAVVAVVAILCFVAFYELVIAQRRPSGLDVGLASGCLLLGLALLPIWGPVAYAIEVRAREVARAELSSIAPERVGAFWWLQQTIAGLAVVVRRLYLGIVVAIVTGALVFVPARTLGLGGSDALAAWNWLQPLVTLGLVSAFAYLASPSEHRVFSWRDAVRTFPRFAGFWTGMTLSWSVPLVHVFAPTLGVVAATLWSSGDEEHRA